MPQEKRPACEILRAILKLRPMSRELCLRCKGGRLLCGRPACPLLARIRIRSPVESKLKESLFGPSPGIFVGWRGYPNVFVGPLTSIDEEKAELCDNPASWYGMSFDEIIRMRSLLVRSKVRQNVSERSRVVELTREVALAVNAPDTEVHFERRPSFGISFSPLTQPLGPSGPLKKLSIAENPKIPRKVDALAGDEVSASCAATLLYREGYDVYYLTRVLSSGALGHEERRRLVPTRWSITAVDDLIGRALIEEIHGYPVINEYRVYHSTYLDNHFEVLLMPRRWEYEQFEAWAPNTLWTLALSKPAINVEHEGYHGRSTYAEQEGGGYYAARFAVLEALARMRLQAGAVVFREIYEGYIMPVGVWEVRENVRQAFRRGYERFSTLGEALENIGSRLRIPLREYLRRSTLLNQSRLEDFLPVSGKVK